MGGHLYLRNTQITSLPEGLSVDEILFKGILDNKEYAVFDGIGCIVHSTKVRDGVTIRYCQKSQFEDGELTGNKFYVASDIKNSAHGESLQEAVNELLFKSGNRDIEAFRNLPLDTVKSPEEWAFVYRMVTGACQYGTKDFMSRRTLKDQYTLSEIIAETAGAYGHSDFVRVVCPDFTQKETAA